MVQLYDYQEQALDHLRDGCVLCGKVGSGKSLTGLFYYIRNHSDKPLYIITVAKKRDDKEWQRDFELLGINGVVDSWNNIKKYKDVKDAFFIFDEQRAVGYGTWGRSLIDISRRNKWIMLSATPGDTWIDFMVLFIANGFYRNKSHFIDEHVEYKPYTSFPQIKRYHKVDRLERYRRAIIVSMADFRKTNIDRVFVTCDFDRKLYDETVKSRFNPFTNEPIMNASEFTQVLRKIVCSSDRRKENARQHIMTKDKLIVFYNYIYELEILIDICEELGLRYRQWNGSRHESIPDDGDGWIYLVQYIAGSEAWNCITTDTILFYSLNYSYRIMEQSEGRINRINTPFETMHYIYLKSSDCIDDAVYRAIKKKEKFNERNWVKRQWENWKEIFSES